MSGYLFLLHVVQIWLLAFFFCYQKHKNISEPNEVKMWSYWYISEPVYYNYNV